jgi:serine/threonine protein phosphatase PrpC
MGGGSSKSKKNGVQSLDASDVGSDDTASVAELAKRSRTAAATIKPLPGMDQLEQSTPEGLPKTFSASQRESPPDDDFGGGSDDFLMQLAGGKSDGGGAGAQQPGTPPGFGQRSSTWEQVQATPARAIGGDEWCAGESTDIGGRKENQDMSFGISLMQGKLWVGGVFDGHGAEGRAAAAYARDRVQAVMQQRAVDLLRQPEQVLKEAFKGAHTGMAMAADCTYSGTTAVCCVVSKERVVTGWCGDSRAVIGGASGGGSTIGLTEDHRPEVESERERIEDAGGLIRRANGSGPMRVYGGSGGAVGLMLTRSLGDMEMHEYGVSAEPQISSHTMRPGVDEILLLGSDGVFDAMENPESLQLAGSAAAKAAGGSSADAGALAAAGAVVATAADWWKRHPGSDNITAIVVTPLLR